LLQWFAQAVQVQPTSTWQGYNLLVIETHSVEDVSNMGGALGTIRQAAILRAGLVINPVTPAWLPVDLWACMKHTDLLV